MRICRCICTAAVGIAAMMLPLLLQLLLELHVWLAACCCGFTRM